MPFDPSLPRSPRFWRAHNTGVNRAIEVANEMFDDPTLDGASKTTLLHLVQRLQQLRQERDQ